jgi:hypothetical protein
MVLYFHGKNHNSLTGVYPVNTWCENLFSVLGVFLSTKRHYPKYIFAALSVTAAR